LECLFENFKRRSFQQKQHLNTFVQTLKDSSLGFEYIEPWLQQRKQ